MSPSSKLRDRSERAIHYILRQHEMGYPDTFHRTGTFSRQTFIENHLQSMGSPNVDDSQRTHNKAEGNIFHVALITDTLIDALEQGHDECSAAIDENVVYLKSKREGKSWRYFPGFTPLPPDADDLGQIAQVLVRSKQIDQEVLDAAFDFAANNAWEDGAVNTWLMDNPRDRVKVNHLWGRGRDDTGKDVEVVANLLYGALLYDRATSRDSWARLIERGITWIVEQQHAMGFWRAGWYVGTYYSTYAVIRLLAAAEKHKTAIQKALRWATQSTATDPMNRAFVTLSSMKGSGAALVEDLEFIMNGQNSEGYWEAIPLLDNHARVWGSRTVSTSFCLKALIAARQAMLV